VSCAGPHAVDGCMAHIEDAAQRSSAFSFGETPARVHTMHLAYGKIGPRNEL